MGCMMQVVNDKVVGDYVNNIINIDSTNTQVQQR